MKTIPLCKQSGSSLVVVMTTLATLMVIVAVAADYTWTVHRNVQRSNTLETAVSVGDACLDLLFTNWRATSRVTPTTAQPTSTFNTLPLPTAAQLNLPAVGNFAKRGVSIDPQNDEATDYDSNYTISNYKVIAVRPEWTALGSAGAAPVPELGLSQGATIATTAANFDYIASADVTLPALGPSNRVVARVRRVFQKQQISPWNFAIFYLDPLEIHPGANFTVTGWVHTNSDLYTGHDYLTFADKVTYGSDWFAPTAANPNVGFKPGDLQHPETPMAPHYPNNLPPAHDVAKQPFGLDSTQLFNTADANPNNDSYHELVELPSAGADPLASARYWNQASVVIRINANNSYTIGTPNANGTMNVLNSGSIYTMFNSAITTNQSITNNREAGAAVKVATLDISQILNAAGTAYKSASFTTPIIYIYDNSATTHPLKADGTVDLSVNKKTDGTTTATAAPRAIRLKNGSKIPAAGLTVVSNNPVYIQGDLNTGGNPPSNSGNAVDAITPQVAGYTRAPVSILGDSINILSNSWSDALSGTSPAASNTTVNAAIVSGIVPTAPVGGDGSYSGGAENFPRFLENWSGHTFTYYGSMVELYKSQQATGKWTTNASVYSPPVRQWYFDNNFKIKPPPGTIMLYSYVKGKWSVL
ncbi:MAG: hypothetical protein DLM73_06040 [Chthoniobacterales bacterium]|nr:MAG: hypothetical protein DLM73_06040 [Chthoniobacterales bacterium]